MCGSYTESSLLHIQTTQSSDSPWSACSCIMKSNTSFNVLEMKAIKLQLTNGPDFTIGDIDYVAQTLSPHPFSRFISNTAFFGQSLKKNTIHSNDIYLMLNLNRQTTNGVADVLIEVLGKNLSLKCLLV